MSDFNDSEPFATAGSGKSDAEVAFELVSKLKGQGVWGERNQAAILDMFAECLDAVKGLRAYEGQRRVNVPIIETPAAAPQRPAQAQPPLQTQAQTQAPTQAAPVPAPSVTAPAPRAVPAPSIQPVQAQPQRVQPIQVQPPAPRQG